MTDEEKFKLVCYVAGGVIAIIGSAVAIAKQWFSGAKDIKEIKETLKKAVSELDVVKTDVKHNINDVAKMENSVETIRGYLVDILKGKKNQDN